MNRLFAVLGLVLVLNAVARGASVILNEYNAVDGTNYFNGGTAASDGDGPPASQDTYFGRVVGNGGDWFELVIVEDHLDMRRWGLEIWNDGIEDETLTLTDHAIWSDLRSGTIITVSENVPDNVSYNPLAGDWWINVQAMDTASGLYIEPSNFPVSNNNWQLIIRDRGGSLVYGPAGEGVSPAGGVDSFEVFRLEADPSAGIACDSAAYQDGDNVSTFGSPNVWGQSLQNVQDFSLLRAWVPEPTTLILMGFGGLVAVRRKHKRRP